MHTQPYSLELVRLAAAARANIDDARVWRWYADLMEDDRVSCMRIRNGWRITVDGRCAVRPAAQMWSDIAQAQVKLKRRRKTAAKTQTFDVPQLW